MSRFQFPTNDLNSWSMFDLVRGTNFSKTCGSHHQSVVTL